ncbi:RSP_2648 family PIN domain-containing protein [Sedimentimonas flavescens]|uniref:RSP_2648 family PIN domain-containing protein n=1 Tax=Sedimentimonas flavescens TaxID=2851012 RepID=UPI0021A8FC28|nr:PIN domain-containing protein [Sedimentimonas flavescens]MCT2540230.1 PIN domain-containing protein [Sedimentimonas flavescens]WBL34009.1 PIN domain-containing protein [Sinirhodobacter sp. HNIBRBA609]
MKVLLDACVLFPTVLREILIGVARAGYYTPLWSDRILEEWARAAARFGPADEAIARGQIALLRVEFPKAGVAPRPGVEARLHLPDENDIHVLAAAISGHADAICTFNAVDFPRNVLAAEGLTRRDPDGLLWELWSERPEGIETVVEAVRAEAERLSGVPQPLRPLLKRAKLPRLGKALG